MAWVFTKEEVFTALKQMHPNKSPGLDGMSPLFFLTYWDIIDSTVTEAVLTAFNFGNLPSNLNHKFIVLITKNKLLEFVADFHPISICNVLYKIVSKVLVNRLKCLLPNIISPTQSVFVPRRIISNNILVVYEIMHLLNHKTNGQDGYMSLKLDISKAYD